MTETLIKIDNIFKIYNKGENEVRALDGVSLNIKNGEFVSIVGNSGSGKSTLMNILGCLDLPDSGKYYLSGHDISSLSDRKLSKIRSRTIGFVFQGFHLISTLSAIENVELPMVYMGFSPKKRRLMAAKALERVGLGGRMNHKPSEMSGGQQQRVAIARAIASNPPIILADEPTGNLDSKMGNEIITLLKSFNNDGKTVILITHDNQIAIAAHRLVTVYDGKIV